MNRIIVSASAFMALFSVRAYASVQEAEVITEWMPLATSEGQNKVATVLIHGLQPLEDPSKPAGASWQTENSDVTRELSKHSDVFAFRYSQNVKVDAVSDHLEGPIAGLKAAGYEKIVLVGHSAGGIVAQQYLERHLDDSQIQAIQVAAPNQGSGWARGLARPYGDPFLNSLTPAQRGVATTNIGRESSAKMAVLVGLDKTPVPFMQRPGDFIVNVKSQWPESFEKNGIWAESVSATHQKEMNDPDVIIAISRLVKQGIPVLSAEEALAARAGIDALSSEYVKAIQKQVLVSVLETNPLFFALRRSGEFLGSLVESLSTELEQSPTTTSLSGTRLEQFAEAMVHSSHLFPHWAIQMPHTEGFPHEAFLWSDPSHDDTHTELSGDLQRIASGNASAYQFDRLQEFHDEYHEHTPAGATGLFSHESIHAIMSRVENAVRNAQDPDTKDILRLFIIDAHHVVHASLNFPGHVADGADHDAAHVELDELHTIVQNAANEHAALHGVLKEIHDDFHDNFSPLDTAAELNEHFKLHQDCERVHELFHLLKPGFAHDGSACGSP